MEPGNHGRCLRRMGFTALAVSTITPAGCEVGKEFRAAATPAIHTGVSAIVNGLVDGLFAAIEVEPDSQP